MSYVNCRAHVIDQVNSGPVYLLVKVHKYMYVSKSDCKLCVLSFATDVPVSKPVAMSKPKAAVGESADIPQILHALDQGTVLIRFFKRRSNRPEKRIFCLKTDTFEILQYPMSRGSLTLSEERSMYSLSNTNLVVTVL